MALKEAYAGYYGHDPSGNWILLVHVDDTTEMYYFEHDAEMWCCDLADDIRTMINEEVRAAGGTNAVSGTRSGGPDG